jgi:hypothetical protein
VKRLTVLAVTVCLALVSAQPAAAATVTYPQTTANFPNPERGLYHHTGDCDKDDFSVATLENYRTTQAITLVMCVFYLAEYKNSPIGQPALTQLQQQFDAVRAAGLKMILRFAYTTSTDGADASKDRVLAHLDQLAPYLQANSDVIDVMQAGFIGAWGEGYYTQNFGNAGNITPTDWANRKAVTDKLLGVLPATRMVQLRTPKFKRTMYGADPLPPSQAHNGTARARLGHHNDCFLASPDDFGTYENPAVEYPYLEADTAYVAMGGETCAVNPPRSSCPTALDELSRFHWSYLNTDYNQNVLAGWGSCLPEITRRLGYRFALQTGTYPASASPGGALPISITIRNDGFATPTNPRGVALILRNTTTGTYYWFTLNADPRTWTGTTTLTQTVTLPADMPAGSYALLLTLPDPQLPSPAYAVHFANENVWEPSTGWNNLLHTVTVG